MTASIILKQVGLSFGDLIIHRNIDFQVSAGESLTLLGPSGVGKTLILKMIIGLIRPTKGEVIVQGRNFTTAKERELQELRRKIGILFQGAALFDSLTVFENIAYSLRESGTFNETQIKEIVAERLEIVGLAGLAHKSPPELSGGQKKRVGLARALASSPEIMLFDEPTTGLDPTAARLIDDLIVRLNQDYGLTCVSVTHDIESARRISQRWILINHGLIIADGPSAQIADHNEDVRDFIGGNWREELEGGKQQDA